MTLSKKQADWRDRYLLIPDPQDRLAAIIGRRSRLEPLGEGERVDGNLVPGCVSRLWLVAEIAAGRVRVRIDGEAALVTGLAAFLAELYDGELAEEARAFEVTVLEDLGIHRLLSPTRAQGMGKVVARIRALAAG